MNDKTATDAPQAAPLLGLGSSDGLGHAGGERTTMADCIGTGCKREALQAENDRLRAAMGVAYGYLWWVNNEPGTPHQYAPERAAYEARKVLRDLLTRAERGHFINVVALLVRSGSGRSGSPGAQG